MVAKFRNIVWLVLAFAVFPCAGASLDTSSAQDEAFRQLRDAARKGDAVRATELAASLRDYPVPSYVDYYLLKSDLRNADETQVDAQSGQGRKCRR